MRPSARLALRWAGRLAAGTLGLVLLGAGGTYGASEYRLRRTYRVTAHPIAAAPGTAGDLVAHGRHVATVRGCTDCHGANLGGRVMIDVPAVGRFVGANLTSGRRVPLTDADWERAVRHGVRRDGTPLIVMPANEFTGMSDEDLAAVIAYARSLPPVVTPLPANRVGPVLRALSVAGQASVAAAQIDHAKPHPARVAPAPTAGYGAYMATGCTGCHGAGFGGGKIPGAPPDWKPAANLTPAGIGHYTEADFIRALRTGRRPGGAPIDTAMPWKMTREMTDVELRALYAYLRTLPARPYGSR